MHHCHGEFQDFQRLNLVGFNTARIQIKCTGEI